MNKGSIIYGIAAAVIGSGLVWYAGIEQNKGMADWETLNTRMEQVIGSEAPSEANVVAESGAEIVPDSANVHAPAPAAVDVPATTIADASAPTATDVPAPAAVEGMVNVNTAAVAGLMELPGIGAKKAQAIIDYRDNHGPFKNFSDLGNVKGIGPKVLEKLKPVVQF